ncbi:YqaJ viral recombinase family protein [Streptomyces sp. NPDC057677]|uniref:YqaJ viral recombinase family nuclease n=1 Tax=unclassified Streptomyces TaxID=2593676 RepID=UPI0036878467
MTLAYPSGAQIVLAPDAPPNEWHAVRATGIGGSDIVAICGLNQYTSPLEIWLKKRGEAVPRRNDPVLDESAEMGHELEPFVASRFTKKTGLPVIDNPGTLRLPTHPHMLVNLDRATIENDETGALEIKTRSSYALKDWIDEAPVEVQIQTQWQIAVTGWSFAYAAASIGGQRVIVHRINRDQQMIDNLIAIGSEFWGWVQSGTRPPLDGSHATGQLLDRLHANPVEQVVIADPAKVEKWLKIRATAKEQAEAADIAITEAENHLKAIAGDATDVHIRGELAYSWRPRRGSIHWKEAALDADPDIDAEQYRGEPTRVLNVHLENL